MTFEFHDVTFAYKGRNSNAGTALSGICLSVQSGECLGVMGQEGAGKTTLLQLMNGLLKPDEGAVSVDGSDIWHEPGSIARLRKRIGFAFQFPEQQFFCQTVHDELLYAQRNFGDREPRDYFSPDEAMKLVGLSPARYLNRSPFSLSMGEARRVALAVVLMTKPDALLLDEPTVGLDRSGIEIVENLLLHMKGEDVTIVLVSHDVDTLAEVASRIIVLEAGTIHHDLPVQTIFSDEALLSASGYQMPEIMRFMRKRAKDDGRIDDRFYTVREARGLLRSGREA